MNISNLNTTSKPLDSTLIVSPHLLKEANPTCLNNFNFQTTLDV